MINISKKQAIDSNPEVDFDDLMASLFVLMTHHSLTQSDSVLEPIVERLHQLSRHTEIELYPNQQKVISKMQHLWRTRLFSAQTKH